MVKRVYPAGLLREGRVITELNLAGTHVHESLMKKIRQLNEANKYSLSSDLVQSFYHLS